MKVGKQSISHRQCADFKLCKTETVISTSNRCQLSHFYFLTNRELLFKAKADALNFNPSTSEAANIVCIIPQVLRLRGDNSTSIHCHCADTRLVLLDIRPADLSSG
jgi:hypothetical protein